MLQLAVQRGGAAGATVIRQEMKRVKKSNLEENMRHGSSGAESEMKEVS